MPSVVPLNGKYSDALLLKAYVFIDCEILLLLLCHAYTNEAR